MDGDDEEYVDAIALEIDGEAVVRTSNEDCEACGSESYGVLVPVSADLPSAFDEGIVICRSCYNGDEHYDTDEQFGIRLFNK